MFDLDFKLSKKIMRYEPNISNENFKFKIIDINSTKFIYSSTKGLNAASLGIFIRIGSRHEKRNLKGIAHFLEHMLFKGSKNYSYRKIKQEIEGRGGVLNGFTSQETTCYYSQFLNKNIGITLDILLDMVISPSLELDEINKERNVILEEIKMHNDLPHLRVGTLLDKILWGNHPLGDQIIGRFDSVKRIQKKDIVEFKNSYYLVSNMVIVCVGDFDEKKLMEKIRVKIRGASKHKVNLRSYSPPPLRTIKTLVEEKKLNQTHLCLGFRAPSYLSKERLTADLIHVILGANMSSRLFEEIREKKGLCYDISTETRKYKDSGGFLIHLGLDATNITIALKAIMSELKRIKNKKLSSKELERAKDFLLGQTVMALERPQGRMFYMADFYLSLNKIYTLKEVENSIQKITPERIRRVSQHIFDFKELCLSCITSVSNNLKVRIEELLRKFI